MARQRIQTISDFDQLKKVYPDYSNASFNQLLLDLTSSGFTIAPAFYKKLQDFILKTEADEQVAVANLAQQPQFFPAAANAYDYGSPPVGPDSGGGGGGGGRSGGGGGGGGAAMSPEEEFAAWKQQRDYEAQLEAEARTYQAEQDRIQREWQAEQDRIERENRFRLQRLGDLTNLVGQFAGIQARARETLAGLQGDPFKFASAKMGLAPQGVTPGESFRGELNQFIGQPMPQIDPNAPLSGIEQQIQGLSGQMAPQAPKLFGMAEGGAVGPGNHRVLVGEEGPEIVEGGSFRVLPLTGKGAAGYDTNSLLPALAPLYSGLGYSSVPRAGGMAGGHPGFATDLGGNTGNLGFNPRLLRDVGGGGIYYRGDAGLQHFKTPEQFQNAGFNWGDVLNVTSNQLSSFGPMAGDFTGAPGVTPGLPNAFGPLSSPIIEPVTGAILPAPYRAAATLNHLRLTNPQFYQLALSAYANSMSRTGDPNSALGYSPESVEAEYMQALPTGRDHGLIGLR